MIIFSALPGISSPFKPNIHDDDDDDDDDDGLVFYAPVKIFYVISRRWKDDIERFSATKCRTVMGRIPPLEGLKTGTTRSPGRF